MTMVAACKPQLPAELPSAPASRSPEWRLVRTVGTVEEAHAVADQLRRKGVTAAVSMIGGLSVLARAELRVPA